MSKLEYRVTLTGPNSKIQKFIHTLNKNIDRANTEGLEIEIDKLRCSETDELPGFTTAKGGSSGE